MEAMRRLVIELPEELADEIAAHVRSGRFASESEVVVAAVMLLDEENKLTGEAEEWLRATIPARVKALDEGRMRTKSVDELRASLERRANERDQAA